MLERLFGFDFVWRWAERNYAKRYKSRTHSFPGGTVVHFGPIKLRLYDPR